MSALWATVLDTLAPLRAAFGDDYGLHVLGCYGVTAIALAWLTWSTVAANARARRALGGADKERMR